MDKHFHIADLIARKNQGLLGPEEQKELERYLEEEPALGAILEKTSDPKELLGKHRTYGLFDQARVGSRLEEDLFGGKTISFHSRALLRYAAAIMLPLLVAGGLAWWLLRDPSADLMAEIDSHIHPGTQTAVLVLSDGKRIELDPSKPMNVLEEGDATIRSVDRGVAYEIRAGRIAKKQMRYNKLITPRGGSYQLTLADGSRVWLNTGSVLSFPVSFHDSVRQVFLEGEAYFEVQHSDRPFIVHSGELATRVLGTSFNVSAYADDAFIQTTLLEGKVEVSREGTAAGSLGSLILAPQQQASLDMESGLLSSQDVDASGYVSWTEGKIEFHQESLDHVMKRLARWYSFEYQFENDKAKELSFSARLDRSAPISDILEMLALTTDVSFEYRGDRILVH